MSAAWLTRSALLLTYPVEHVRTHGAPAEFKRRAPGRRGAVVSYHPRDAALFHSAPVQGTRSRQRFVSTVLLTRRARSQGSAHDVGHRAEDGAHHCRRQWSGRTASESRIRRAVSCTGGPAQGDGVYHRKGLGVGPKDTGRNGWQLNENHGLSLSWGAEGVAADLQ